jgi:hypothetical protein
MKPAPEGGREHLGDLGLADAGLSFEEQRPAHLEREEQHGRERTVGEVIGPCQQIERVIDRGGQQAWRGRLGHGAEFIARRWRACPAKNAGATDAIRMEP